MKEEEILKSLSERYPPLLQIEEQIRAAYELLKNSYEKKGKLLICGNGGSAADGEHIVGELMKGFLRRRELKAGAGGFQKAGRRLPRNCRKAAEGPSRHFPGSPKRAEHGFCK